MLADSNFYSTPAALTAVRSGGDLHVPHPQLAFPREAQQGSVGRRVPALPTGAPLPGGGCDLSNSVFGMISCVTSLPLED